MESPAKDHRLPPGEGISSRLESFIPSNRIGIKLGGLKAWILVLKCL